MKVLSVSEFAEFCKKKQPSCYIYATQNQQDSQCGCVRLVLRFNNVIINLKPDRICFMNEHDKLNVERVKCVQMFNDIPCVGIVFKIHSEGTKGDVVSTWIMD